MIMYFGNCTEFGSVLSHSEMVKNHLWYNIIVFKTYHITMYDVVYNANKHFFFVISLLILPKQSVYFQMLCLKDKWSPGDITTPLKR